MEKKSFLSLFKDSFQDFYKNPIVILPALASLIFLLLFSKISLKVNTLISNQSSVIFTIWLIIFTLISLLVLSYLFAGLIGLSLKATNGKARITDFFFSANKYYLKNFAITLIILVCYDIINFIAIYGAYYIGKSISLSTNSARILFFFIYFAGLIGILLFMAFSSFYLIYKSGGVIKSLKSSARLVSNNYPYVLAIAILLFICIQLVSYLDNIDIKNILNLADILSSIILYPYLALVLSRFLISFDAK